MNLDKARTDLEQRGFDYINSPDVSDLLQQVLTIPGKLQESVQINGNTPTGTARLIPTTFKIGSGKDFLIKSLNVDVLESCHPDAIVDLADPDLLGKAVHSQRHGAFVLGENQFELIVANDVLEHIPDLVKAMGNCLALLRVGGQFRISVPYDVSFGARQDPTHVRAFNERSWLYHTEWFWYQNWSTARCVASDLRYDFSPVGLPMQNTSLAYAKVNRKRMNEARTLVDRHKRLAHAGTR